MEAPFLIRLTINFVNVGSRAHDILAEDNFHRISESSFPDFNR